eukprot:6457130-Amphidinium_carterae.1
MAVIRDSASPICEPMRSVAEHNSTGQCNSSARLFASKLLREDFSNLNDLARSEPASQTSCNSTLPMSKLCH